MTTKERHEAFIEEMRKPIRLAERNQDDARDELEEFMVYEELEEELERKFEELFGQAEEEGEEEDGE